MRKRLTWNYVLVGALACASLSLMGCGDDDGDATDGGASGKDGGAANGGSGGSRAGSGGSGGRGGAGAGGSRAGSGGSGGAAGMMMVTCSEPAPTQPVVCGGQTCAAPTGYPMNPCIVPCCITQNGSEACGAKSTNPMYLQTECQPAVTTPDPSCNDLEGNGMMFEGCCNAAQGKCGIISTVRPGCITMSQAVMLPNPLQSCSAGGDDGGADDAGL